MLIETKLDFNVMEFSNIPINSAFTYRGKPQKKWRTLKWLIGIISLFIIVFFGFKFGIAYHQITVENEPAWKKIAHIFSFIDAGGNEKEDPDYALPTKEEKRTDIAVLGIRGEEDKENGGLLADSIMILSIDLESKKTAIISIPRDLLIKIPGLQKKEKVNTLYPIDLERGARLALVKEMLSRISGIFIDHVVVINMNAFQELVESLEGVTINLQKPFEENQQWGYPFRLEAGTQELNGEQALYYVRSRFSSSDFDRARRQQQVISAIQDKLFRLGFLANPFKINELINILQKNVRTDVSAWELQNLIRLSLDIKGAGVKHEILSTDNLLYETADNGAYVLLPKNDSFTGIKEAFKNILN